MATCALWKVSKRLETTINYTTNIEKTAKEDKDFAIDYYSIHKVIDYVKADYKTEQQCYVSGINCEPEFACMQMKKVKKMYNKENGILAYHGFQSFKEGEVTPEQAHKIGIQLAEEMWGDRFQVVVSTHLNTKHIHNHFVVNSVSFVDGKKFYSNRYSYGLMRHLNDEICKEYKLSVLEEKECKKSHINFGNYYLKYEQKNNYSITAKKDIDFAIRQARTYKEFLIIMKKLNYDVINRYEKLSVKKSPYKRNIRIERQFGDEYTIKRIKQRILEEQTIRVPFYVSNGNKKYIPKLRINKKRIKVKGLRAIYLHYQYLFKIYKTKPNKKILTEKMRKNIERMNIYSEQIKFINKNNINTKSDLTKYISNKNKDLQNLTRKREQFWSNARTTKNKSEKEKINLDIKEITKKIKKTRKEVRFAEEINYNMEQMKNDLKEQQELEEKQKEQQKIQGR